MKNEREDKFSSKFCLLNTQKSSEYIIWSCSDSSDYENKFHVDNHQTKQVINRKRKRTKTKTKAHKNFSNLSITYSPLKQKSEDNYKTSPIFHKNIKLDLSPLPCYSTQHYGLYNPRAMVTTSPLLPCNFKNRCVENMSQKSPILISKHASPKPLPNVRKKLFTNHNNRQDEATKKEFKVCDSGIFNYNQISENPKSSCCIHLDSNCNEISNRLNITDQNVIAYTNKSKKSGVKQIKLREDISIEEKCNEEMNSDKSTSLALVEKVSSYFDSHFSSETPSQQSISEYESTAKDSSKTSEEIEFINSLPDTKNMTQTIKLENGSSSESLRSFEYDFNIQKSKKIRFKKGGLAYRLSVLTKKQKANISLWQHERYLAINSNFVLPNVEFSAFRIQKISYQYGSYLLETMDVTDHRYVILINNIFVNNISLKQDIFIKLYKPFRIIECDADCKMIVNVCKFECMNIFTEFQE